jgi:gluconokinase
MPPIYPKSPKEMVGGMRYFARLLDKIRLHARGELGADYHENLGKTNAADGVICNFLRVNYAELRERVLAGGNDEEVLEWCYAKGRRLNEGDLVVWNGFMSKFGWNDFATPVLERRKKEMGISDRTDIKTIGEMIDFDEGRLS